MPNPPLAEMNQALTTFMGGALVSLIAMLAWVAWRKPNYYSIKRKLRIKYKDSPILLGVASRHGDLVLLRDGNTPQANRFAYVMGLGIIYSHTPVYGLYTVELPFVAACMLILTSKWRLVTF